MIRLTSVLAFRQFVSWSQRDLAEAIPVGIRTVRRWEKGDVRHPFPLAAKRLTDLYRQYHFTPE